MFLVNVASQIKVPLEEYYYSTYPTTLASDLCPLEELCSLKSHETLPGVKQLATYYETVVPSMNPYRYKTAVVAGEWNWTCRTILRKRS